MRSWSHFGLWQTLLFNRSQRYRQNHTPQNDKHVNILDLILTKADISVKKFFFYYENSNRGQLKISNHIRILHVEQEVHGDDTLCVDSVLSCDLKRQALLDKEKELNDKLHRYVQLTQFLILSFLGKTPTKRLKKKFTSIL